MKNSRYILMLFCLVKLTIAQDSHWQKTILHFEIEEAAINGEDYTNAFTKQKAYMAFYKVDNDSVLLMALVWQKEGSQTWGRVQPHSVICTNEMYEGFKSERSYYRWDYKNSFNDNTGSALVELIKVVKPEGLYYVMKVFLHGFDLAIYKGYLNLAESDVVKVLEK